MADLGRAMPARLLPMLATLASEPPAGEGWSYEIKWDGIRAIVGVRADAVSITSRLGNDLTGYPELSALAGRTTAGEMLLDGEVVALDDGGRPSFQRLQRRMHVGDPAAVRRLMATTPVVFMIFDLLWRDGRSLLELPYLERRTHLEDLGLQDEAWQVPPRVEDAAAGAEMLRASAELGLEGVVAKQTLSRYEPGRRSPAWRKLKHQRRQELVVGGWLAGHGAREGTLGALLVGHYDDSGLVYAGRVGTGFSNEELRRWDALLAASQRIDAPFSVGVLPRGARFVDPNLVVEVRFTEWTDNGQIRHPTYLGLRGDVRPEAVRREPSPR